MHLPDKKGFTLVELMVVISIIAILSVVGITVFTNARKSANDGKRRGDIDSISKAYEVYYAANARYDVLDDTKFSGGKPKDPRGNNYYEFVNGSTSYKVCAALEAHTGGSTCNGSNQANTCHCKSNQQGLAFSGTSSFTGNDPDNLGWGSSSPSSCDTFGTLDDSLVGYWKMDDPAWNGTLEEVKDFVGSNHGTSVNATNIGSGPYAAFNKAGSFNGNAYINLPNNPTTGDKFTVTAWVTLSSSNFNAHNEIFQSKRVFIRKDIGTETNKFSAFLWDGSTWEPRVTASLVPTAGTWYHIAVTYDQAISTDNFRIYVNGANEGKVTRTTITDFTIILNRIGGQSYLLAGDIDDVRVYNRVLSDDELKRLAGVSPYSSPCVAP